MMLKPYVVIFFILTAVGLHGMEFPACNPETPLTTCRSKLSTEVQTLCDGAG